MLILQFLARQLDSNACVQYNDLSTNAGLGSAWEWSFPGGTPATSTDENPIVCYTTEGEYSAQLKVKNGVGENTILVNSMVVVKKGGELPFSEDFEAQTLPSDWLLKADNTATAWTISNDASAYGIGSSSIVVDNKSASVSGSKSSFITQRYDLSTEELIYDLVFDVAYARNGEQEDTLTVYVTSDCGTTLNTSNKIEQC